MRQFNIVQTIKLALVVIGLAASVLINWAINS